MPRDLIIRELEGLNNERLRKLSIHRIDSVYFTCPLVMQGDGGALLLETTDDEQAGEVE